MARTVSIGEQNFERLITENGFYVDKTLFIKEWWESKDIVTLLTRPRRFGKTLNMNMLDCFFSIEYKGKGDVFQNLTIWQEEKYRKLQGTYPVLFFSFAGVKSDNYVDAREQIFQIITDLFSKNEYLRDSGKLGEKDKDFFDRVGREMSNSTASMAIYELTGYLYRYYGRKVIILLDEYDTPLQEAYVGGYWEELVSFMRDLFNNTFKTNPHLERAMMAGITQVSKESLFSDLNNLNVVTTTSNEYASCFGFTEEEVFSAMDEFGMTNKEEVKRWYDGFAIGDLRDIYNPWSINCFLDKKQLKPYWANTSSNGLIDRLIREGGRGIKMQFELLLADQRIRSRIHEEMAFNQLEGSERAVWSLLLAAGYLKVIEIHDKEYELSLTNYEVKLTFEDMVRDWFDERAGDYNDFIKALLRDDIESMNDYMGIVAETMFSFFDGGQKPSEKTTPERFYHGFVLGLLVDLAGRYEVTSNRESGFGRYDVMLKPLKPKDHGIIMEFKIYNPKRESSLEETVQAALNQKYEQTFLAQGIEKERVRKYGFAFRGKEVLIGSAPLL